jgi:two-component system KDP operon response regulator KdpE
MITSVLVVEDDPTLVRALTRNLAARGYAARDATTVAEALAALDEERPAVLLLDIDLPDGSGWDIVRSLRGDGGADVAVIVMSALQPNPRLCHEFHAAGVLEKPFPLESLLRLVAQATGRLAAPDPAGTMSAD